MKCYKDIYRNKKVFVTGHTGFKGSWLVMWLNELGAKVKGFSLPPPTEPNHWDFLNLGIDSVYADIRDKQKLEDELLKFDPEIVFHLAAQPLVRYSYENPVATYETNVIGTLNLLEACKHCNSTRAIINITSDKCYHNQEWIWGYRETDPLGGFDPYSSSKGCSEILTSSYRNSYFNLNNYKKDHFKLLASVRAGNVIGGGDWAIDRLVPDVMKSTASGNSVTIRNPNATRPWQHVLEPLSGYLLLGQHLLEEDTFAASAWNFGPSEKEIFSVTDVVKFLKKEWQKVTWILEDVQKKHHEAVILKLDSSKANQLLKWQPTWYGEKAIKITAAWYRNFYKTGKISSFEDLTNYLNDAILQKAVWINA